MTHQPFETANFDLAVTRVSAGLPVSYTGAHQGVFRFECMKIAALKASREGGTAEIGQGEEALRRFFTLH